MTVTIGFCNLNHALEPCDGRGKEDVILAVSIDSRVDSVDLAAKTTALEDFKEMKAVKAVGKPRKDLALANPVAYCEGC